MLSNIIKDLELDFKKKFTNDEKEIFYYIYRKGKEDGKTELKEKMKKVLEEE
jgi:hypothetical protein